MHYSGKKRSLDMEEPLNKIERCSLAWGHGGMGHNGFILKKKKKLKVRKKSWGPFMICLLNNTANLANLHLDWAKLAVLFSRQILKGTPDLFLAFIFFIHI